MRPLLICAWLLMPAGCASGSLRDAKQALPLDRSLDVVQSIPTSPQTVARLQRPEEYPRRTMVRAEPAP